MSGRTLTYFLSQMEEETEDVMIEVAEKTVAVMTEAEMTVVMVVGLEVEAAVALSEYTICLSILVYSFPNILPFWLVVW